MVKDKICILKQFWVAMGIVFNIVAVGVTLSFPSSLLPALRQPDSPIQVDLNTASLLASSPGIASPIGFIAASVLMDALGRRAAHALSLLPSAVGWGLIYWAPSVSWLILGRMLCGLTAGASVTLGSVIIGEYSSPKYRGVFLSMKTAAVSAGAITLHAFGHHFHWQTVALIALGPVFLSICNTLTWSESPSWYAAKGRYAECETAFYALRGTDEDAVRECEALVHAQKKRVSQMPDRVTCGSTVADFFKKFTRKDFLMPVFVVTIAFLMSEACGRHAFPAFALDFISDISGDPARTFLYTMVMDGITTTSSLFALYLNKAVKRRTLIFFSGISSVVILLTVSSYLYLVNWGVISRERSWVPLSLMVVYFVVSNLGATSIPLMLLGELVPLEHRAVGTAVCGVTVSINLVSVMQATPMLMATIGTHGTLLCFASVMVVTLLILYLTLPETHGRTLQEIEEFFKYGKTVDEKLKLDDVEVKMKMLREV
ncbi:hypothetical protein JYU34_019756 [Plutella xylostella]|uniref:Major facilitator superfamily (MFS) profile domain-containing protein n=1 Tax=Plutella xylostella TaxID=51655 RepID=A0ABQ7PV92_PLUXY|nr:hypothetical protein JYU34_019756 [Plutella xylostella]